MSEPDPAFGLDEKRLEELAMIHCRLDYAGSSTPRELWELLSARERRRQVGLMRRFLPVLELTLAGTESLGAMTNVEITTTERER